VPEHRTLYNFAHPQLTRRSAPQRCSLSESWEGNKHPLGVLEGATENAAVVQALLDNLIDRGLDPKVCRLFIVDGAKGKHTLVQRCQIHKGRNIMDRFVTETFACYGANSAPTGLGRRALETQRLQPR
jgi:hypothetical protein